MTETFTVKNVKCGGCVSAIEEGLGKLDGVSSVSVVIDSGTVTIEGEGLQREQLAAELARLGYPEA